MNRYVICLILMVALGGIAQGCDSEEGGNPAADVGAMDVGDTDDSSPDVADVDRDATPDGGDAQGDTGDESLIGESCPDRDCLFLDLPPGGVMCDACGEGNWCYTPTSGPSEAYCAPPCSDNEDCAALAGDWECNGVNCVDAERR